ncbi:DNA-binding transcriptional activator of the SARP family [Pseudonocardia thermophila]|jgi:DNA-binding transcriptional activator of the SARP family|uniref:DNA-binding transcriptional activator of the SARP family n=1 Tax=Pseudonocardia thermophila TaxID=1848 RepID=A0A1M6T023_PSETH|nr:BTAD domain-containing putative transcriptional regulator [Pseudonocardia thermophila]SHK50259.1 DNA-binding transcriptional activator of the SARP family [Pseudonocardia thermophila]
MPGGVRVQLFGRFQVRRDGAEIPPAVFGGRKVRTLLRVLAVRRPDLVPHAVLAVALWPERLPADPTGNLGVLVNRARRALGDPASVVTGTGGYALGTCTVDVAEFTAALDAARAATEPATALRACTAALTLWGEPLAEDTYAEWARPVRERLLRDHVEVCERAAAAALALGDPRRSLALAAEAAAAEPLRESAVIAVARALAATGDPAAALARLAGLRAALAEELGVDPSPEVERLQLALLRNEVPTSSRVAAPALLPDRPPVFGELAFVGRTEELAAVRATVAGSGIAALVGRAGSGKSRLIAELVRQSQLPVIAARAFLPERAEPWSLTQSVLREALALDAAIADSLPHRIRAALAELLPELGDAGEPVGGESRRALLLTGALRLLEAATGSGALLVVDDLQWADPSSVTLLASALARLPRLAAVVAMRPEELPPGTLGVLHDLRESTTHVALGPLPGAAIRTLVGHPGLAEAVERNTDGTPFAVAELLRELTARSVIAPGPTGWTPRTAGAAGIAAEVGRAGQLRAVQRRAVRFDARATEVLRLLALLAREAPARTIADAAGIDGRAVLDALSRLAAAGLVRLGERGWATAHDLVAETVTAGLDPADRGRLHSLLARALDADPDGPADAAEVARHHRDSGDATAAAAAFARAAHRALARRATREAAASASAGLALAPHPPIRADLLAARAEAAAAHGELATAGADLRTALADTPSGPQRSRRRSRLAMLTFGARDPHLAAELAELALVEADSDAAARAFALETAAIIDMNLGHPDRARTRAEEALRLYRDHGDGGGVARILDGRAMATFLDGRIADGVAVFGRVAQLFTDSGDLLRVVTPLSTRGHGLVFMARPTEGLEVTTAALQLARDLDAPEGQAYALWHRSEALSALARADEAAADAAEALAIARAVDHQGWTATAHRAAGIAAQASGDLDTAAAEFAASADVAGDSLTLFAAWAAARSAVTAIAAGNLTGVAALVDRALTIGPPLGGFEARLAAAELAAARADPTTSGIATTALAAARAAGEAATVPRLTVLVAQRVR